MRRRGVCIAAGTTLFQACAADDRAGGGGPAPEIGAVPPFAPGRQTIRMPARPGRGGAAVRLVTTILCPDRPPPYPLLVFHHGSTGLGSNPALFGQVRFPEAVGAFFAGRGWMVAAPMRRGRGGSDGEYAEGLGPRGYSGEYLAARMGFERALEDAHAATEWLLARPETDRRRVLIGGESRGGILAVAYAARHPATARGVLNFVGGWLGEGFGDAAGLNRDLFRAAGRAGGPPSLWLYGSNDPFYSVPFSRGNFDAFRGAGGRGEFVSFDVAAGRSGHGIQQWPELWGPHVERFLGELGLA
ncbi:MAG: alpha/beta hydrolase fold domain-containing protein [Acetobacteraceae bacterium]|nr:alpha/beta hydrolase fold domain-containing protein [Acetobacteraceae bacterium]